MTADAASGSRALASSRFQKACMNAAAIAKARATADTGGSVALHGGQRRRLRLQRDALERRANPLRDLRGAFRSARKAALGTGVLRSPGRPVRPRDHPDLAR